MPPMRPKPSEIATEAKKTYIPYIQRDMPTCPPHSILYGDSSQIHVAPEKRTAQRLRVAVFDGDPVDVALDWYNSNLKDPARAQSTARIPVVNMANEKRAGGDWESGLIAPEECFARRSNLVQALVTPWNPNNGTTHYPIPQKGGIYSQYVVVFRDASEPYTIWKEFKDLPVISVAPVRRPKLDESGKHYSFDQERELMKEKMRTVLRIAAYCSHRELCLGAFGVGSIFRNPVEEVASMWRALLFHDPEFQGVFTNVVFAVEKNPPGYVRGGEHDYEAFVEAFDPKKVFPTASF
ncbi:uncharacterized protein BDZ99DRAFT_515643 [Mytilinidion resinicola]|uniref:Microbial-type PARG catalytic domain-containing protein n=1 Tax=Mytilinidion resinicola TaxID=574789 RepID=A0A6A6Z246_9PEZI|nr:uncharacterized protein BDZ99DRAFT_515643 [Mytilinidion resinicola]KAF2814878.1 hypothetical protein BDZ99DRAFT_515643 [Mytilinidion resinicola]